MSRVAGAAKVVASSAAIGLAAGLASAAFLFLLEGATRLRLAHPALVYALPLAGLSLGWLYERFGGTSLKGTNLVIDAIVEGGPPLPRRLGPLVILGTVATHLFGGSGGREGTAVQAGASLADAIAQRWSSSAVQRRLLLLAGVAGGFGSVFGTPWAGVVFALEFVEVGRFQWRALVPAAVAAFIGHQVTLACGIEHTSFPAVLGLELSAAVVGYWLVFGAAMAATASVFIEATHALRRWGARVMPSLPLRMALGGLVVTVMWRAEGTGDYLGLSIPLLVRAFNEAPMSLAVPALKLAFTAVTLGAGFLGGEVTPLFVIGATLGHVMAQTLGLPTALGAAVGMAALFGGAAKTPVALTVMAAELVGPEVLPHAALVCVVASIVTGRRSIYLSQRPLSATPRAESR